MAQDSEKYPAGVHPPGHGNVKGPRIPRTWPLGGRAGAWTARSLARAVNQVDADLCGSHGLTRQRCRALRGARQGPGRHGGSILAPVMHASWLSLLQ